MADVTVKPGDNAVMVCDIIGYPVSKVNWSFIPCPDVDFNIDSCKETNRIKFVSGEK